MSDDRTIDEALADEAASLEPTELEAGEAMSLEEVLDTIFNILALHSTQLQAIAAHITGAPEVPASAPRLHVVGDVEGE